LIVPGSRGVSGVAAEEIEQAMARSQALESA
jgi:hypothetical protein